MIGTGQLFPHLRWRSFAPALGVLTLLAAPLAALDAAPAYDGPFRLGFSYAMFTDVNENDARASLHALATAIAGEREIIADPNPLLLGGSAIISQNVRSGRLDAVAIATDEYWQLTHDDGPLFGSCLLAIVNGDPTEEYIVLVRPDRGATALRDLAGKRLMVWANSRLRIAYLWLEVALARAGATPAAQHFAAIDAQPKLSKVVLDVFFGRSDAALVTRRGYSAMVELNPQVGRQIMILETSPRYIPSLFAFRAELAPAYRDHLLDEFSRLESSPAGQQTLTIFQTGHVARFPISALDPTLALLDEFARLCPEQSARLVATRRGSHQPPWEQRTP